MALTPNEIRNKQFTSTFRGYNTREVDKFQNEVYYECDKLIRINAELAEKNDLLVEQLSRYKEIEEMLNKTLIVAQETADNVRQNAKNEAQHIIKEANINADRIVSNAIERAQIISSDLDSVKSQTKIHKAKLKILLEEQMALLENEEE